MSRPLRRCRASQQGRGVIVSAVQRHDLLVPQRQPIRGPGASSGVASLWEDGAVTEHVYKVVELVGTSRQGVDDAIQCAITRAGATLRNLRWFEVMQIRGAVGQGGKVEHTQVTIKAGFTLEGE